jgi:cytochrome c553
LFENNCAVCHGQQAAGQEDLRAPALAGLPQWYVLAQLDKFRDDSRGAHFDDLEGMRMRPMARTLANQGEVEAVAFYIGENFKPGKHEATFEGDAAKGKGGYATCMACHGADGTGNEAMNAPPLVYSNDWYLLAQLHKFKSGVRGANADEDPTGASMAPMAAMLADEQAMKDVIAHIRTLAN